MIGDAGIVVREDDVDGWRRAIASLAAAPERCVALRAAGLRHVEQYQWPAIAAGQLELYRIVAAPR